MKLSYIMQSYLGEYPGSREKSDIKFLRAVYSFINQDNKNSELVIVSDGCEITHMLYLKYFKSNARIKYVYVDKDTLNMYEGKQRFYRGFPRQVGRSLVTGEVTTYIDSDDFLIPNATDVLLKTWEIATRQKEYGLCINLAWYDNVSINFQDPVFSSLESDKNPIKIDGLDSKWISVKLKKGLVSYGTVAISHLSNSPVKWKDVVGEKTEDFVFGKGNKEYYKDLVFYISEPIYVRCHATKYWDY